LIVAGHVASDRPISATAIRDFMEGSGKQGNTD